MDVTPRQVGCASSRLCASKGDQVQSHCPERPFMPSTPSLEAVAPIILHKASSSLTVLVLRFQEIVRFPSASWQLAPYFSSAPQAFSCSVVCVNQPRIPELSHPPWTSSAPTTQSGQGGCGRPIEVHTGLLTSPGGPVQVELGRLGGRGGAQGGWPALRLSHSPPSSPTPPPSPWNTPSPFHPLPPPAPKPELSSYFRSSRRLT